jgi:hypothetical protein
VWASNNVHRRWFELPSAFGLGGIDQLVAFQDYRNGSPAALQLPIVDHRNNIVGSFDTNSGEVLQTARYSLQGRLTLYDHDPSQGAVCNEEGTNVCPNPSGMPFGFNSALRSPRSGLITCAGSVATECPWGEESLVLAASGAVRESRSAGVRRFAQSVCVCGLRPGEQLGPVWAGGAWRCGLVRDRGHDYRHHLAVRVWGRWKR